MSTYAYLRVSTDKQYSDNQKYEILNYAHEQGLGQVEIITETASGKTTWKKRELAELINTLEQGDCLIVSELSRLGRSLLEIFELLSILLRQGVLIHVVKGDYTLKDDLHSKVITFAFSIAAELERDLLSQRTREALARKRSEGVTLGRPKNSYSSKLNNKLPEITILREKGVSLTAISKIYDVTVNAIRHFCLTRKI
jgi:DNA invertase Pin-like site-specific DNA recombinase